MNWRDKCEFDHLDLKNGSDSETEDVKPKKVKSKNPPKTNKRRAIEPPSPKQESFMGIPYVEPEVPQRPMTKEVLETEWGPMLLASKRKSMSNLDPYDIQPHQQQTIWQQVMQDMAEKRVHPTPPPVEEKKGTPSNCLIQ